MRLTPETHPEVERIAHDWEELADRAGASPFMRPGWFAAWRRAFGRGRLEVLALRREDGRLAALAPFERQPGQLRAPTNWHTPHWHPLAEGPEALDGICRLAISHARPWLSVHFGDAGSEGFAALRDAIERANCRTREYTLERSPRVEIEGTWDQYSKARLTSKRRSNLRRLARRLEERGELRFEVLDGRERLAELLEEGFAVEESSWKGEEGTAVASSAETRSFYTEICRWGAERGWLRLAFLRLDERPIAFDLAFEDGGSHYLLKTGYDDGERSFAPGVLLRMKMLERAFDDGLREYEFLGDEVEWKVEWTDDIREMAAIEAFTATPAGAAGWFTWAYTRPAVNTVLDRIR